MNFLMKILTSLFGTKKPQPSREDIDSAIEEIERQNVILVSRMDNVLRLRVERTTFTPTSTIGVLYVNGKEECYTLEDDDRLSEGKEKIPGRTAIPLGTYNIFLTYSPKFGRILPVIKDVPGFRGVRIHTGNTADDTEGCLLVGTTRGKDFIGRSRDAFKKLFTKFEEAKEAGKTIKITFEGKE